MVVQEEKHRAALQEVQTTIQDALSSTQGLLGHQRRLMAMLSLGTQHVIELYLHKQAVLKSGAQIKHEWFKLSDKNIQARIQPSLTKSWSTISNLNEICAFAQQIETERNDIVYGAPLDNDKKLRECLSAFLSLRSLIRQEIGEEV